MGEMKRCSSTRLTFIRSDANALGSGASAYIARTGIDVTRMTDQISIYSLFIVFLHTTIILVCRYSLLLSHLRPASIMVSPTSFRSTGFGVSRFDSHMVLCVHWMR